MATVVETIVAVAEAVKEDLAAAELSQSFRPERSYGDFELELADDQLHVDVVPVTTRQTVTRSTRGSVEYALPIDIAVRRRLGDRSQQRDTRRIELGVIDGLMRLLGEIHHRYLYRRLPDLGDVVWDRTEILAAPALRDLKERRTFVGVVRLTFVTDVDVEID